MFSTTGRIGKLIAGASTLALASVGLLGVNAAFADNIDLGQPGSLTVHKSSAEPGVDPGTGNKLDPDPGKDKELDGITFTVQEVLKGGASLNLATSQGWADAQALGTTPNGDLTDPYSLGGETSVVTGADGIAEFGNLHVGMYLVKEVDSGNHLIESKVAPFYVTIPYPNKDGSWNYDVHVYPKNVLTTYEATKSVDDQAGLIGKDVVWTIDTRVPQTALPYKSLTISDPMTGDPLEFKSWGDVAINGGTPLDEGTDYNVVNGVITFAQPGLDKLDVATADAEAHVTVQVVSKVTSVPTDGNVTNTAHVTLNGQPSDPEATTNVGQLTIKKVSEGENPELLDGATFELYAADADGNRIGSALDTQPSVDGLIKWSVHLGNDSQRTFWVKETVAPTGYVLPADPWTRVTVHAGTVDANTETISNFKPTGPNLPMTGAQGTLLFTVAGIGLMVAAGGALMVRRARRNHS